ncbi:MAG: hypothetical protein WCB90_12235 [Methanosarcina sp.]
MINFADKDSQKAIDSCTTPTRIKTYAGSIPEVDENTWKKYEKNSGSKCDVEDKERMISRDE